MSGRVWLSYVVSYRPSATLGCAVTRWLSGISDLEQELVLGEALNWFQQVGVQAQFVLQFPLALLAMQGTEQRAFESQQR